jgi:hypothetical protein
MSARFYRNPVGRGFASGLPCQVPSEGAPQSAARGALRSGDRAAEGMLRPHHSIVGAQASRYGVASSFGRDCSALRGRTIRVVAFRASHPAKPPMAACAFQLFRKCNDYEGEIDQGRRDR